KNLRDRDGLELLRAHIWGELASGWHAEEWTRWAKSSGDRKGVAETLSGGNALSKLRYGRVVQEILDWLLFLAPCDGRDYLLNALETAYSLVPAADMKKLAEPPKSENVRRHWHDDDDDSDWRNARAYEIWSSALSHNLNRTGHKLTS